MIDVRAAIAEPLWEELCLALCDQDESAGIILAGRAVEEEQLTLCFNRIIWVPDDAYEVRSSREMWIRSEGWMPALGKAAAGDWQPIFFHTHPDGTPLPSRHDERVARQLTPNFEARTGRPYASLILSGPPKAPCFTGTLDGKALSRIRVVGDRIRFLNAADTSSPDATAVDHFDRQIRAFGADGQRLLRGLRIGVVGSGGTGSAVFEQLLRLGVGSIFLLDDDTLSATNLTRIHESAIADVGYPKVEVMAAAAERVGLGNEVIAKVGRVTERTIFESLRGCDVVFGCTDDNAGRAILSRLAYYYCLPVFDVGVVIGSREGRITGLEGRLTTMAPGAPCLFCRDRIDTNRMREEMQTDEQLQRLAAEGYARELEDPDPAVVTYTTMIATFAVDEMLQRLFGFGDDRPASELLVRAPQCEIRRLSGAPRSGHFCADLNTIGRGDREPPLDRMWT